MKYTGIAIVLVYLYHATAIPELDVGIRAYQVVLAVVGFALLTIEFGAPGKGMADAPLMPAAWVFLAATLPSVFLSEYPTHSWPRWLGFACLMFLLGPIISTPRLVQLRKAAWRTVEVGVVVLVLVSLVWETLGLPDLGRAKLYAGITDHSMILGPLAAIAVITVMAPAVTARSFHPARVFLGLLLTVVCLLAASRAAIGGMVIGFLVTAFIASRGRRIQFFLLWATPALAVVLITLLSQATIDTSELFYERVWRRGLSTDSRDRLWESRYREFNRAPITGIGFSVSDDESFSEGGHIEPGSSYLLIAATTGVLGIVGFAAFLTGLGMTLRRRRFRLHPESAKFMGVLAFFLSHQLFEGYIISVGSVLTAIFWLAAGRSFDLASTTTDHELPPVVQRLSYSPDAGVTPGGS